MRKLKHYEIYLTRLTLFADALNVKIIFDDNEEYGTWIPRTRVIRISEELTNSDTISVLLHELGHSLDDLVLSNAQLERAYKSIYTSRYTKNQLALVVETEEKAWSRGRNIAHRLKIRLGKWYTDFQKKSIKTYKQ